MYTRLFQSAAMLVVAILVLSGCAPRAGTAASEAVDSSQLVVDLPAIVIDFGAAGEASIGNIPVSQLGAEAGLPVADLALPAEFVTYFTGIGIQHLQVVNSSEGLDILVNGMPVPSLVWNEGSLVTTAETVKRLGVAQPVLERVLPLVQKLGVGVVLRFPVEEGAEAIPLGQVRETDAAAGVQQAQADFLQAVGTPPRINVPIFYDESGTFSVGDLSGQELQELVGPAVGALRLPPSLIQTLMAGGVSQMSFATDASGIHISVNEQELPTISWGRGELQNVLELASQAGLADAMPGMDIESVIRTVQNLLPVIQTTNANITIFLPGSEN